MADDEYRNGRHVVYKLHAHLIFVTKHRKKVMTDRVGPLILRAHSGCDPVVQAR